MKPIRGQIRPHRAFKRSVQGVQERVKKRPQKAKEMGCSGWTEDDGGNGSFVKIFYQICSFNTRVHKYADRLNSTAIMVNRTG